MTSLNRRNFLGLTAAGAAMAAGLQVRPAGAESAVSATFAGAPPITPADISRTWVHGNPTKRQREVWDTVKRGQEIVLETAKIGAPVGDMDIAVRNHYEGLGWATNYGLPGTSHRAGHGIGMDGHEPPNLMRADRTPLAAGMCFSNEPGIYIPGEFGVRMEDCWHMTEQGPRLFTPLARSIDEPI